MSGHVDWTALCQHMKIQDHTSDVHFEQRHTSLVLVLNYKVSVIM